MITMQAQHIDNGTVTVTLHDRVLVRDAGEVWDRGSPDQDYPRSGSVMQQDSIVSRFRNPGLSVFAENRRLPGHPEIHR